jgi:hypothetical protein
VWAKGDRVGISVLLLSRAGRRAVPLGPGGAILVNANPAYRTAVLGRPPGFELLGSRDGRHLWEQLEGRHVSGAHDGEVAAVEGGDLGELESFCRSNQ